MSCETPKPRPWTRPDSTALILCASIGLILAVSPHLATLARYGTLQFLSDQDDVFYLALSRAPYYGELTLRSPYSGTWEDVPVPYAWMQYVPLAKLTRLLGLPLILTSLVGRIAGGCLLGGSLFILFRKLLAGTRRPTAWALGCSLVCLADGGFVGGNLFLPNFLWLGHLVGGTTYTGNSLPQYRYIWPLLNLPFLLLLIAALVPGGRDDRWPALLGITSFGLCILLLFYLWTAAALALGVYLVLQLGRAWRSLEHRPEGLRQARLAGMILIGGFALGSPQVYENWRLWDDSDYKPILERAGLSHELEPDDPHRGHYLKNRWAWAKLAVGAAGILAFGSRALAPLWCFTLAGFALVNSALVTGLEFENFHWMIVHAPVGEIMVLCTLALAVDRWWRGRESWLAAAWLLPGLLLAIALVWRPYEALHARETVASSRLLGELRPLRSDLMALDAGYTLAGPRAVDIAILFSRCAPLYGYYMWFSLITEDATHERHALNGWLRGLDEARYAHEVELDAKTVFYLYPGLGSEESAAREARVELFRQLLDQPEFAAELLERYRVGYLLRSAMSPRPERGGPWTLIRASEDWALWSRQPGRPHRADAPPRTPMGIRFPAAAGPSPGAPGGRGAGGEGVAIGAIHRCPRGRWPLES